MDQNGTLIRVAEVGPTPADSGTSKHAAELLRAEYCDELTPIVLEDCGQVWRDVLTRERLIQLPECQSGLDLARQRL